MQEILIPRKQEAYKIHHELMAAAEVAADAFITFCRLLKKMRDEKLYKELGYENFELYCERAITIKYRQAYSYIRSLETFGDEGLQAKSSLGIRKLSLIQILPDESMEQFIDQHRLEDMTTRQVETAVKEWKEKYNQVNGMINAFKRELQSEKEYNRDLEVKNSKIIQEKARLAEDCKRLQEINQKYNFKIEHSEKRNTAEFKALFIDVNSYIGSLLPKAEHFLDGMDEEQIDQACDMAIEELQNVINRINSWKLKKAV